MFHSPNNRSKKVVLNPQREAKERSLVLALFSEGPIRASHAQQMLAGRVSPVRVLNLVEDLTREGKIEVAE